MKARRIQQIKNITFEKGSISLDELCEIFGVSKNTIRRDVNILEKEGSIKKVYGGIQAVEQVSLLPFDQREIKHAQEKEIIGQQASLLVDNGDIIFIDSGTTTSQLMKYLPKDIQCTILTTSLNVIEQCDAFPNITLIVVGSIYKRSTRSFIFPQPGEALEGYNINKAFLACTGLSIENGLTNSDPLEQEIKRTVCSLAKQLIVLADHSKYDQPTLLTYSPLDSIHYFVTDVEPPSEYQQFFNEYNIHVLAGDPSLIQHG